MSPREHTPEERAMIALAEGRNAFANLRKSHADLLSALRECEAFFEEIIGRLDLGNLQEDDTPAMQVRAAISRAERNQ